MTQKSKEYRPKKGKSRGELFQSRSEIDGLWKEVPLVCNLVLVSSFTCGRKKSLKL